MSQPSRTQWENVCEGGGPLKLVGLYAHTAIARDNHVTTDAARQLLLAGGMKLTSDHPYWLLRNGAVIDYPTLQADATCECVVVGAGVTGAMLSDRLSRSGFDVIVVDSRSVCTGSTSASTALLLYDIDVPLIKLSNMIGWEKAQRAYRLSHDSIDAIESLALSLPVDVDFRRNRSIYLAVDAVSARDIRSEANARASAGLSVEYHTEQELDSTFGLRGPAALSTPQAASCDPIRFSRALLERATSYGARVFDGTRVVDYARNQKKVVLTTQAGSTITADYGIIACGYESIKLLDERVVLLNNTYALISEPLSNLEPWDREWMLWEACDPYLYMRVTADNRLLVGGEDDAFVDAATRDGRIESKMKVLHHKLKRILPNLNWEPATGWAGTFGQTKDGLPYIGSTDEMPGYIFALGFGGNGMTFSEIACEQIVRMVHGQETPDAQLFRFGR